MALSAYLEHTSFTFFTFAFFGRPAVLHSGIYYRAHLRFLFALHAVSYGHDWLSLLHDPELVVPVVS